MWAATASSYCPSRAGELPKQNMTKYHERWDGKLCTISINLVGRCRPGALLSGGRQVGAGLQFEVLEVARRRRSSIGSRTVVQVESAVRRRQRGDHARDGPRQSARRRRPVETEHLFDLWVQFTLEVKLEKKIG